MNSRFLDLGTCVCRLTASEEIQTAMHHYVSPFLIPAGDGEPHVAVSVGRDTAAVTQTRQSVADQPPTTVRTSHPEQRSNDRTVLIPTDTGRWHAAGVPLAARFTPEGVGGSPTLTAALDYFEPSRGRHLVDGKIELTPQEISALFKRPAVPVTEVAQLVILIRSPHAPAATRNGEFVRHHLDFGTDDFFADDWLNLRPHLKNSLTDSLNSGDDLWERLAETVPVLPLTWTDPAELPSIATTIYRQAQL